MKKMILATAITALSLSAQAQKNSWYAGGNVGLSSTTHKTDNNGTDSDGSKQTAWSFSPEVGTFLTNQLQLGIGVTLMGSKDDARTAIKNETKSIYTGATVYSRYFFGAGNFRPFVGVNVSVLPGNSKTTIGAVTTETNLMNFGANLNAGFAYGLTSRVTVVGSLGTLGFQSETSEVKGSNVKYKTTDFGLDANSLGNRFNIGVYYTFKK
jgi:outer membrane protein W